METWCHTGELTAHVDETILDLLGQSDFSLGLSVAEEVKSASGSDVILGRLEGKVVIISGLLVENSDICGAESASTLPSLGLRSSLVLLMDGFSLVSAAAALYWMVGVSVATIAGLLVRLGGVAIVALLGGSLSS